MFLLTSRYCLEGNWLHFNNVRPSDCHICFPILPHVCLLSLSVFLFWSPNFLFTFYVFEMYSCMLL